jgi:hypothetical protein
MLSTILDREPEDGIHVSRHQELATRSLRNKCKQLPRMAEAVLHFSRSCGALLHIAIRIHGDTARPGILLLFVGLARAKSLGGEVFG